MKMTNIAPAMMFAAAIQKFNCREKQLQADLNRLNEGAIRTCWFDSCLQLTVCHCTGDRASCPDQQTECADFYF